LLAFFLFIKSARVSWHERGFVRSMISQLMWSSVSSCCWMLKILPRTSSSS
jgi:hypothetical protein